MLSITITEFIIRLCVAFALGAVVGAERQWRQRMAGLRTNILVAVGATLFVTIGVSLGGQAAGRVVSYVVSGIGFLGAGVIMKDGMNIRGLNTAATLWCSAAVGALCGNGYLLEASIATVAILLTHVLMRPVGNKLGNLPQGEGEEVDYYLTIKCQQEVENHVRVLLLQSIGNDDRLMLYGLTSTDDGDPSRAQITAEIVAEKNQDLIMERIAGRLTIEQLVYEVRWRKRTSDNDL